MGVRTLSLGFAWCAVVVLAFTGCAGDEPPGGVSGYWGAGTTGGGNTFVSATPQIADDLGAFRRLPPSALPSAGVDELRALVETNDAGEPLLDHARLLLQTNGKRLFVVPTSRGWVCSVLDPDQLPDCSGHYNARPRLYPFSYYDNGVTGRRGKLTIFGLVPDRVRRVEVIVQCRTTGALTRNGGFYLEQLGATARQFNGFVFRFRDGLAKRQTFGIDWCRD